MAIIYLVLLLIGAILAPNANANDALSFACQEGIDIAAIEFSDHIAPQLQSALKTAYLAGDRHNSQWLQWGTCYLSAPHSAQKIDNLLGWIFTGAQGGLFILTLKRRLSSDLVYASRDTGEILAWVERDSGDKKMPFSIAQYYRMVEYVKQYGSYTIGNITLRKT